jgi:general secretion pathway protein D
MRYLCWQCLACCLLFFWIAGAFQCRSFAQEPLSEDVAAEEDQAPEAEVDTEVQPEAISKVPPPVQSPYVDAGPGERRHLDITLDDLDIYPVLDHVLGRILGLNYVVDPAIKGTISLRLQGDFSRAELLDLFNSVLQIHGLAITRGDNDLYKVVRKANSAKSGSEIVVAGERPPHPGDVVRVFQLKYLAAASAIANLRNFISPGATIVAEPSTNAVLLVDTAEIVEKVSKILSLMDTDFFKGIYWRLFSLENTEAEDLAADLNKIFQTQGLYMRPGLDAGGFQILPLKTVNALLVVTKWEELLDVVGHWVEELDLSVTESGSQVYVYFVQNGKAADISDILRQVYGATSSKKDSNKAVLVEREKQVEKPPLQPIQATGELTGEVEIIADEVNNAVVIKAMPKDYAIISSVLEKLDVVPRQVLIDVLILEVTLKDELSYGVEWWLKDLKTNIRGDVTGQAVLWDDSLQLSWIQPGFSFVLADSESLRSIIRLVASKTDTNILSAPNILAVDNKESSIEITQDIPTVTSSTQSTEGLATTQNIQYRSAGIILKVTPTINESGLVRLEVSQEVSQVLPQTTTKGIDSPTFQTRKATTNLVAEDGHIILIGGLMETQKDKSHRGIPLLKDLPILGYFFGSHGYNNIRRELLFAITPHVIRSQEEADALTREFSQKVGSLKEMLESQKGISPETDTSDTGAEP